MDEHIDTLRERGIDVPDEELPLDDDASETLYEEVVEWGTNNTTAVTLTSQQWMHIHLGCLTAGAEFNSISVPPDEFMPYLDSLIVDIFAEAPTHTEQVDKETDITIDVPFYYVGVISSGLIVAAKQGAAAGGGFLPNRLATLAHEMHEQVPEEMNEVSHAANLLTLGEERYEELTEALDNGEPIEAVFGDEDTTRDPSSGPGTAFR